LFLKPSILCNSSFAAQVIQKEEDESKRRIRAQLFAEFHQKISEKDSEMMGLKQEIIALKIENEKLRRGEEKKVRKSLLVPTSPQERGKLEEVMAGHDDDVVLDGFLANASTRITVMNLVCLRSGDWLNSETINVYVLMTEVAAKLAGQNVTSFNSFFVTKLESEVTSM
jgi:Ulp1 family protease